MPYRPTTELVAVTWLKGLAFLGNGVATDLPEDLATWPTVGTGKAFVTVRSVGGFRAPDLPVVESIVSIDTWAGNASGDKPPWARANQVAEEILDWIAQHGLIGVRVDLPSAYSDALVHWARGETEPRRIPGDPGNYAHFTFDLALAWSAVA